MALFQHLSLQESLSFLVFQDNLVFSIFSPFLGKGLFGKCGRKLPVVEEDHRATYGNSDQQADRSESIFTTFESEIKQFVAVSDNHYVQSLVLLCINSFVIDLLD